YKEPWKDTEDARRALAGKTIDDVVREAEAEHYGPDAVKAKPGDPTAPKLSYKPAKGLKLITDKNGAIITTNEKGDVTVSDKEGNDLLGTKSSAYDTKAQAGKKVVVNKNTGVMYAADKDGTLIVKDKYGKRIDQG